MNGEEEEEESREEEKRLTCKTAFVDLLSHGEGRKKKIKEVGKHKMG